ncbi:MAG: hypothetical protein AAGF73_00050 [Actinomycetota bacterium]
MRIDGADRERYWECTISASGVVALDALSGNIESDTPVIITATGAAGSIADQAHEGRAGWGGAARTVVAGADLSEQFYVYMQTRRSTANHRLGGAATVVMAQPIEHGDFNDVFAIGGGGGSQGIATPWKATIYCGAGSGGDGGFADAAIADISAPGANPTVAYGVGTDGQHGNIDGACGGRVDLGNPGHGGGHGVGGVQPGDSRSNGVAGIGGIGGGNNWQDKYGNNPAPGYEAGRGGQTSVHAQGGGGYGGGAGGERNGGGGAGGSVGAAPTASPLDASLIADDLQPGHGAGFVTLLYPAD